MHAHLKISQPPLPLLLSSLLPFLLLQQLLLLFLKIACVLM